MNYSRGIVNDGAGFVNAGAGFVNAGGGFCECWCRFLSVPGLTKFADTGYPPAVLYVWPFLIHFRRSNSTCSLGLQRRPILGREPCEGGVPPRAQLGRLEHSALNEVVALLEEVVELLGTFQTTPASVRAGPGWCLSPAR